MIAMEALADTPKRNRGLHCVLLFMLCAYVLYHDLAGGTLFAHSAWDSYTLQALAWREGALGLGRDYPWLELAVYQGDWYVSFPALPTLVMLPLTFLFGENTPNNFVMVLYAMLTVVLCYKALTGAGMGDVPGALASLFYVWGSNMLWMSTNGGVWFQAQALNLVLLTGMVLAVQRDRRTLACALAAFSVGCRPFSAVAFLPLLACFYVRDRGRGLGFFKTLLAQWKHLVIPALFAGALMAFNYVRFGSVFEFGHNYLPEFLESPRGQFDLSYLPGNLYNLFLRPVTFSGGRLSFPLFNGFMFYIANPMFLLLFGRVYKTAREKGMGGLEWALLGAMCLEILLLCAHKTLGGWQFGARYTVDMLPFALWFLILKGNWRPKARAWCVMALGVLFNAYGTLYMLMFG